MSLPIRLIAVDIDGTLLNPEFQISPADRDALARAHHAGAEVVLVTGRRHTFAMPIAQMLGFDLWLISSNGAITRSTAGETFYRDLLPAATCRKLLLYMKDFRRSAVITFDKDAKGTIVVETTDDMVENIRRWIEKNEHYIERVIPIEDAVTSDPVQAMYCGGIARMNLALARLQDGYLAGEVTILRTQYDARDLCIVDILNQGCSKGHAVERWAKHRGIDRRQVMAIGDNYNDIEMLEYAGVPVIMGNACQELKQNGWRTTGSNAENGVASAVKQVLGI